MIRRFLKTFIAIVLATAIGISAAGCSRGNTNSKDPNWSKPADLTKAAEQAGTITTYALPDDWANYGALIQTYCKKIGATCEHIDTDMSSGEAINRYVAEKGNPSGRFSDIGGLWGPFAEEKNVTPNYVPKGTEKLKEHQYAKNGGWTNTFTGVQGFLVNESVVEAPETWADLLDPKYSGGKISSYVMNNPIGGSQQAVILSVALARGGSVDNLDAAWKYFKELYATDNLSASAPSVDSLIRGEYGVMMSYDFNAVVSIKHAKEQGVNLKFVVPKDGSIYMPSSLLLNGFKTDTMEFSKGFADFVLSDEGQLLFADFGARPIRYVNGELDVPKERRANWFDESMYANTQSIDVTKINPQDLIEGYRKNVES